MIHVASEADTSQLGVITDRSGLGECLMGLRCAPVTRLFHSVN